MTTQATHDLFQAFSDEVRELHTTWVLWRRLFDRAPELREDPEAVVRAGDEAYRVTRETSELMFRFVRWHMLRGALLDLCRLCDPKETMGKENITLERVFEDTDFSKQPDLQMLTRNAMQEALRIVRDGAGLKALRNQLLAHFDLETAMGRRAPADVDLDDVDLAVRWVVAFQCRVAAVHEGRPFDIQAAHPEVPKSLVDGWKAQADNLVRVLAAGLSKTNQI
jgi:hypothetical protein